MTIFFLKKRVILLKKQGFIHGAIILIVANAISKILGAVFKIPLTYILHEEGMGIFNSAFTVYVMGLSVVTAGFPVAVAKSISSAVAENDLQKTAAVSKCATLILTLFGVLGSCILYFGAEFFAYAIKEPLAENAIKTVAPAVAAVAWGIVFKAYFQGTGNMTPTAVSQVIESVCRLAIGFTLALYFASYIPNGAAGAIGGIMIGEFIATGILWLLYEKNKLYKGRCRVQKDIYKEILSMSLPLMLATLAANMVSVVEVSVIRLRLSDIIFESAQAHELVKSFGNEFLSVVQTGRLSNECANWLYGAYSGYAVTLFHLPTGIISTFGVSLFPVVAGAYAAGNIKRVNEAIKKGTLTVTALAVPSAVLLFFLSNELLNILFRSPASADMLKILSFSVVPMCVAGICGSCLHASGTVFAPFLAAIGGSIVKIALCWVLAGKGNIHIYGVPMAAFADFTTVMLINLVLVRKKYGKTGVFPGMVKLFAGGAVMTLQCIFANSFCSGANDFLRICIIGISSMIVYVLCIFMFGIRRDIYLSSKE